jgi:hypothetical protein
MCEFGMNASTFAAAGTPGAAEPATIGTPGCADAEDEDASNVDDDDDEDAALVPASADALLSLAAAGTTGLGISDSGLIVADPSSLARLRWIDFSCTNMYMGVRVKVHVTAHVFVKLYAHLREYVRKCMCTLLLFCTGELNCHGLEVMYAYDMCVTKAALWHASICVRSNKIGELFFRFDLLYIFVHDCARVDNLHAPEE